MSPVYCVDDLINLYFESYIPSMCRHTTEEISRCREMLPNKLVPAPDSMKLHEINDDYERGSKKKLHKRHLLRSLDMEEPAAKVIKISTITKEKPMKKRQAGPLQKRLDEIKKSLDDDKKGFYYAVFYS